MTTSAPGWCPSATGCSATRRTSWPSCSAPSASCCSSAAPTSQICCWPQAPPGRRSLRCEPRRAQAGGGWCSSCSRRTCCWHSSAGVFGVLLAMAGTRLFPFIAPAEFPQLMRHLSIDARVLAFAVGISMLSSLVFGLVPALRASRVNLIDALKEGGRTAGSVRRGGRNALLVAEVSLAMVLLVGAGLLLRGLMAEQRKLPGFDPERLLTSHVLLAGPKYFSKTPHDTNIVTPQVEVFYDQLVERVRAMPGVTRAGIISRLPMNVWMHGFTVVGRPATGRWPSTDGRFHGGRPAGAGDARDPGDARPRDRSAGRRIGALGRRDQQELRGPPLPGPGSLWDRPFRCGSAGEASPGRWKSRSRDKSSASSRT